MYSFTAVKASGVDNEEFESALHCSAQAVQSILYDHDLVVTVQVPSIYISLNSETSKNNLPFSLNECAGLIKGAFVDADQNMFPEFTSIQKEEIKNT